MKKSVKIFIIVGLILLIILFISIFYYLYNSDYKSDSNMEECLKYAKKDPILASTGSEIVKGEGVIKKREYQGGDKYYIIKMQDGSSYGVEPPLLLRRDGTEVNVELQPCPGMMISNFGPGSAEIISIEKK